MINGIRFNYSVLEHESRGEQSIRFHFSLPRQNGEYWVGWTDVRN
jgi:hypothetical protein